MLHRPLGEQRRSPGLHWPGERIGEETGFYPGVPAFAAMAPLTEKMDISSGESGRDLAEGLSLKTEVKT